MAIVKAILREPIKNLGRVGDVVQVRRGFFKYLEGLGKVCYATQESLERLAKEAEELNRKNEERRVEAEAYAQKLEGFTLEFSREATETGALYGAITGREISKELATHDIDVRHTQVLLPSSIRDLGEYIVPLELHPQVVVELPVVVKVLHRA